MHTLIPTDNIAFLLFEATRLMRKNFDQKVQSFGLTRAQWELLSYLRRNEGINQAALADLLEVEPITISRLVDRMEKKHWVERRPAPRDRRAHTLHLGSHSHAVMAELSNLRDQMIAQAFKGFPSEQQAQFATGLKQVCANLTVPANS